MRILFTQESDWLKRNPAQQHHLAEMMSLRGHEIRVIDHELLWRTQSKRELHSRREIFDNISKIHQDASVTVIRPGILKVPWLDYVSILFSHKKEIDRQIQEFSPNVIVCFGIINSYLAARAIKKKHIALIYYWIDVLHLLIPFKYFHPLGKLLERFVLKRADRVLVINDKLRDFVMRLGAPPERTHVLRAGIDLERFSPGTGGNTIRKQYGLTEKDTVLFFMGWLYRFSGLKEIASQLAQSENSNLKLLIVGEGDIYEDLKRTGEKYNLQDRLVLTGRKNYEEIPGLIAASDICVLPAYPDEKIMQDIVPIKMYEYMAMKKPVIATRLPGVIKEFGEDNGVIYADGPEDVVIKAVEMVQNGDVERLGLKARNFATKYSWDTITDEFEKILEEVIKEEQDGAIS